MELQSILSWDGERNSLHSKHLDQDDTKIINAIHKVKYSPDKIPRQQSLLFFFSKFVIVFSGEKNSSKYSMGSRTKYRRCDAYPAANSYQLPSLIGPKIPSAQASNAHSMTSRRRIGSFDQDLARTPGPAR